MSKIEFIQALLCFLTLKAFPEGQTDIIFVTFHQQHRIGKKHAKLF